VDVETGTAVTLAPMEELRGSTPNFNEKTLNILSIIIGGVSFGKV